MAKQIYRKAMLERMASPDQLDKMIVITSPSFWLAMLGGAVIVVVALVWSILGRLPIKQEASGILVPDQGAYTLASETGGIVSSVEVKIGDYVEEGDLIATLVNSDIKTERDALIDRYEKVEAVTLESVGDIVTQDNRELINLKTQIAASKIETEQNKAMLSVYQANLAELKPRVESVKTEMELARKEYYSYIISTADTDLELDFSYFQSLFNTRNSIYESAYVSYQQQQTAYKKILDQVIKNVKKSPGYENDGTLKSAVESLEKVKKSALSPEKLNSDAVDVLSGAGVLETLEQNYDTLLMYKENLEVAENELEIADDDYDEARNDYEIYADKRDAINTEKEYAMALYNSWNNEYNTLYSQMINLEQNISSLQGQIAAAEVSAEMHADSYRKQFEATRGALLYNLRSEIDKYEYNMEKNRIKSTVSGTVSDVKVNSGSALGQGSDVVTIRQLSEENLIVCYIPLTAGKKVDEGMRVIVKPTVINEQEYGHMEAEVIAVDDYVATVTGMRGILGDDALVQAFTSNGPVVGVTCRLRTDDTTDSGYWWSTKKGADLMIPDGSMVIAEVITEEKAPITMLIPYIKEKLSMAVEPGAGSKEGQ